MKRLWKNTLMHQLITPLMITSFVSVLLLIIRVLVTGSSRLTFLGWNLFLAWIPFVLAWVLYAKTVKKPLFDWRLALLGAAWLGFLPNAFYLVTDLIHLQSSGEVGLLYDTALIVSFVLNGLTLGYISLYMIQRTAERYVGNKVAFMLAELFLLLSAFAIYLGRYLRWNSWDIILNPLGIAYDVSDRIINPGSYQLTFVVTGVYFVLLGSFYFLLTQLVSIAHKAKL